MQKMVYERRNYCTLYNFLVRDAHYVIVALPAGDIPVHRNNDLIYTPGLRQSLPFLQFQPVISKGRSLRYILSR